MTSLKYYVACKAGVDEIFAPSHYSELREKEEVIREVMDSLDFLLIPLQIQEYRMKLDIAMDDDFPWERTGRIWGLLEWYDAVYQSQ